MALKRCPLGPMIGRLTLRTRQLQGLTQQEAAERMGIRRTDYGRIERGTHCPNMATVHLLVTKLGVSLYHLCRCMDVGGWMEAKR